MNDIFDAWFDNTFGEGFIDLSLRAVARQAWQAAQSLASMDAQRYCFLCRFDHLSSVNALLDTTEYNTLDAAVDAVMARGDK